jgi:hypothetical protein
MVRISLNVPLQRVSDVAVCLQSDFIKSITVYASSLFYEER